MRLGILGGFDVAMPGVEEVNGHIVLHGAEEFHCGAFIGMPVSRISGMPFVAMAEVCADSGIVTTKKKNEARDLGVMLDSEALSVCQLQHAFPIILPPPRSPSPG